MQLGSSESPLLAGFSSSERDVQLLLLALVGEVVANLVSFRDLLKPFVAVSCSLECFSLGGNCYNTQASLELPLSPSVLVSFDCQLNSLESPTRGTSAET